MTICKVHNVKFYKIHPTGINCMAYETKRKKLAISRSDASIEVWNLSNTPFVERTIANHPSASIEALCWYEQRLFSTGLQGTLIEYNLRNLCPKSTIPITGGVGWCMDVHCQTSRLVIGTEQGYINVYTVTNDSVDYDKILDKQEGRILCLKFDTTGEFIASGSVDTVRVWNIRSGHALHKMNISRSTDTMETVIWCIEVTDNFTIISGDSRGFITFWDGKTGAQVESYQSHCAAVLSVCLSKDKNTVYCSGVDPIIMSYERVLIKGKSDKWVKSIQRKIHDHDVRSLVFAENKLYSAGVDGYLACSYYPPKTLVKYPPLLQNPCVYVCHARRWVLLRYRTALEVWQLGTDANEDTTEGVLKLETEPRKLLELQTAAEEVTICAAIANSGRWLVYSTRDKLRLFKFTCDTESTVSNSADDGTPGVATLTALNNLPDDCTSCVRAEFTPDSRQLVLVMHNGDLQVLDVTDDNITSSFVVSTSNYLTDTVAHLKVSTCGRYVVIADAQSNIVAFHLTRNNCTHHCTLPRYACPPTALGIHPKLCNLLVVYADHKIIEYSLLEKRLTKFSRGLDDNHPRQWLNRSFPVISVTYDPRADHIVFLHDDSSICVIDKQKKLPTANAKIPKLDSTDAATNGRTSQHAFHIIKKNKHLVYFGWLDQGEMVSVEVNPLALIEKMPPCLQKKKFGTK
ncbi:lethal (3) 72Dn [Carabus blaptoides fortunei]